jgi:hypothetical protein
MTKDRMEIYRSNKNDVPDYGSLFLIKKTRDNINEYGGSYTDDVEKLDLITDAGYGSTCLFTSGDLYRKEFSGWNKMGEEPAAASGGEEITPESSGEETTPEPSGEEVPPDDAN